MRELDLSKPVHASCVALDGAAALILGASGSGKSELALELMSVGAQLVSDDRTQLTIGQGKVVAAPPNQIAGLIEARGVGILRADFVPQAELVVCVDLDQEETERLPEKHTIKVGHIVLPLLYRVSAGHFKAAILQMLRNGRSEPR